MPRGRHPSRHTTIAPWFLLLAASTGLFACGSCGTSPSNTPESEPNAFQEPDPELVAFGARLYRIHGCVTCHTIDGRPSTAPTFLAAFGQPRVLTNGRRVTVNEDYLRRSIREPSAEIVAGYTNQMIRYTPELLAESELEALVAFIVSLRHRPEDTSPTEQPADPSIDPDITPQSNPQPAEPSAGATPEPSAPDGQPTEAPTDEPDANAPDPDHVANESAPLRLRADGRPEWWLDRPMRDDSGRAMLCAEALGETFRGTGDRALEEARRQLRIQLNLAPNATIPDEQVERTLVLPLPNPGGAYRFVGYVKVSGTTP